MTESKSTIDQQRATHALKNIRSISGKEENDGMYVSYVSALPATIVMNGLGQALATQLAKAKDNPTDSHRLIYNHLASWLCQQVKELGGDSSTLLDRLMENDQKTYVHAQAETMAYLNWLKQFARALLNEEEA